MIKKELPIVEPKRAYVDFSIPYGIAKYLWNCICEWFWPTVGITLVCGLVAGFIYFAIHESNYGFIENFKWYVVNEKGIEYELFSPPAISDFQNIQSGKCVSKTNFPLVLKPGEVASGPFYYLLSYRAVDGHEDRKEVQKYFLCFMDRVELQRKN